MKNFENPDKIRILVKKDKGVDMFVEEQFYIGVLDFDKNYELMNERLLYYLESAAAKHSNIAGIGIKQMEQTRITWVLINWKVDVNRRPKYNENIRVKTWSASVDRLYAYRDFEIYDSDNKLIATATSKWVLMNMDTWKVVKLNDEMADAYKTENMTIYPDFKYPKVDNSVDLTTNLKDIDITSNMIDINNHVHNTYYYTLGIEALPDDLKTKQFDHFDIIYKKEIKKGEKIKCNYTNKDGQHIITIINENNEINSQMIIQ